MNDVQTPSQAAGLFQKAHGRIVMLQRIDAQIAALLSQRRRVQNELTEVHSEINEEFSRLMTESDGLPAAVLAEISGTGTGTGGVMAPRRNGNTDFNVPSVADEPTSNRIDVADSLA